MTAVPEPEMSYLELLKWILRTLHRWPEPGHDEHRTSAFLEGVLGVLGVLGIRFSRPAPTSVGPSGNPSTAFRADLDAIARTEKTGLPFASVLSGVMHACGYDGNTAALVVLARRLARRHPISPVLLIFQQAEEVHPSGAPRVIKGLGPAVWPTNQIYGMYLWPELPEDTIGLRTGALMPGISGVTATFHAVQGRSHGTWVDAGASDALNTMIRFCHIVKQVVPAGRCPTSEQQSVVHIGMAQAGEAPNQPAVSGSVKAAIRWLAHDACVRCEKNLRQIAEDITAETGIVIDICIENDVRPLVDNAAPVVDNVAKACGKAGLTVTASYPQVPLGVSDDFGRYLDHVPGALFLVGCGAGNDQADLHDPKFDFREEALLPIVDALELLARQDTGSMVSL